MASLEASWQHLVVYAFFFALEDVVPRADATPGILSGSCGGGGRRAERLESSRR
jgi:hypothetical protein